MNAILSRISWGVLAAALAVSLIGNTARAQAPEGPQGGKQQGAPPVEPKPAPPQQKPQEAGASIAVEVPVVTMDVIAATNHGDLLTGLKKENFRIIDDGVAQTISNFGSSEAPITIVMLMEFSSRGWKWILRRIRMRCATRFITFIFRASASRMCLMRFWTRPSG